MDNLYCDGTEDELMNCRFEGWGYSDCDSTEAAGVICSQEKEQNYINSYQMEEVKKHEL